MATVLNARPTPPATDPQKAYLRKLAAERVGDSPTQTRADRVKVMNMLIERGVSKHNASRLISYLQQQPVDVTPTSSAQAKEIHPDLTPGVYDVDGHVYVVKPNRAKTRLYAQHLVEIASDRLTESGDMVKIEFEYEPGAIFNIHPDQKMPFERAKALTIRYGRCIVCGRHLKAGKSVERGIGPVCRKSFA